MVTVIKKGTPLEEIKERIKKVFSKTTKHDIIEYAGKLNTEIDPLKFQKELRDEWK